MKKNDFKVIVAHPGQQHSYYSAISLGDMLEMYITTQYYRPYKSWTWVASLVMKGATKQRILKRHSDIIDCKVKTICELNALICRTGVQNKYPVLRKMLSYYDRFGHKTANIAIKKNVDAVIMYDTTALQCFWDLEGKGVIRILDVTIGSRVYAREIYEKECELLSDNSLKLEYPDLWKPEYYNKFKQEIELADYAIAGSEYVKRSLIYSGMDEKNIFVVPYGTDFNKVEKTEFFKDGKLNLLFVGQVNYRKGVHRLLEVVTKFSPDDVHLRIVGSYNPKDPLFLNYNNDPRIEFLGLVPHNEMVKIYQEGDVFVLPSLSEGMARVGIEALGCGLPLICTENTGVNDFIEDGINGFTIPVSDNDALYQSIQWFLSHKDNIYAMSSHAQNTASLHGWDTYYKQYKETVCHILSGGVCNDEKENSNH